MSEATEQDFHDVLRELEAKDNSLRFVMYTGDGGIENMAEINPVGFLAMYKFGQITSNSQDAEDKLKELVKRTIEKLKQST